MEEEFETKVRELRRTRNKARLLRDKNPPAKRHKIQEDAYISIRKTWGAPTTSTPKKHHPTEIEQQTTKKMRTTSPDRSAPTVEVRTTPPRPEGDNKEGQRTRTSLPNSSAPTERENNKETKKQTKKLTGRKE